jgi:hypothetical protein
MNFLWTAFRSPFPEPSSDWLTVTSWNGNAWTKAWQTLLQSKLTPAMTVFGDPVIAYVSGDQSNRILITYSAGGGDPFGPPTYINQTSQCGPSLAVFNDRLYVAFVANDPSNRLLLCSSPDGATWSTGATVYIKQQSEASPALAVFNNELYVAFLGIAQGIYLSSSPDGFTWPNSSNSSYSQSEFAPALCVAPFAPPFH